MDPALLEREYVYAEPPISITELSDKYGLARSGVADKARIGKWYEKRKEFRARVSDDVRNAMAEKWSEMQVAVYERLMKSGIKYLDQYDAALEAGDIKPNARDMIAVASMMKALLDDMSRKPADQDPRLVSPDDGEFEGDEAEARDVIERVKALMAGGGNGTDLQGLAQPDAAQGAAGAGED